jgi:hypothetical protein
MRGMSYQCDSGGRAVASADVMVVSYIAIVAMVRCAVCEMKKLR